MAGTSAYAEYAQMSAASQGAMAGGAQPRLDTPAAPDYSAYGKNHLFCKMMVPEFLMTQ